MMEPINKKALRAAILIHEHLCASRNDSTIYLPPEPWTNIQDLRRRIERAGQQGWHRAASRQRKELGFALDDARRVLESASRTLQDPVHQRPISAAAEIYRDLVALGDEFDQVDIDLAEHEIAVTTEEIVLEGVSLGRFEIRLEWQRISDDSQCYRIVALDAHPAAARDDVTHPHVQDERLCEGEGRLAIRAARDEGRLLDFFLMVAQVLNTYARGSAYVELDDWQGVPCESCGDSINEEDRYYCRRCDAALCGACMVGCGDCGESHCPGCLSSCAACGCDYCSACLTTCRVCHKQFCSGCREDDLCLTCYQKLSPEEDEDEPSQDTSHQPAAATL